MVSPTCPIPHHPRNDVPNLSCPTAPLKQCPQPAPSCSTPEPKLPICPVPKHPCNDALNLSRPIAPQNDVLNLSHPTAPQNDVPNLSCPAAPFNPCPQPALSHSTPCARHNLSPQGDTDRDRTLTTTPTLTGKSHPLTHPHVSPPKPVSRGGHDPSYAAPRPGVTSVPGLWQDRLGWDSKFSRDSHRNVLENMSPRLQ